MIQSSDNNESDYIPTAAQTGDNFYSKKHWNSTIAQSRVQNRDNKKKLSQSGYSLETNKCGNCRLLEKEINGLIEELQFITRASHDKDNKINKLIDNLNELEQEIKDLYNRQHNSNIFNGSLQNQNMQLRTQILAQEQEYIVFKNNLKDYEELQSEYEKLKSNYNYEHKFVESLLQMVQSCHPNDSSSTPPNLKSTWKWLKSILQEYMQLKTQKQ